MKLLRLKIIAILFSLVSTIFPINAQEGSPFQTDFNLQDESQRDNYSICQDNAGVIIIANRKGILTFDAEEWKLVKTPELPIVVSFDPQSGLVFVGCRNNIGYLFKNNLGDYEYKSMAGTESGTVTKIAFTKKYVWFLSQSVLTKFNSGELKDVRYWKSKPGAPFLSMMVLKDKLLVDVASGGLQSPEDKGMQVTLNTFSLSGNIIFSLPFDNNNLMLGASDNKCYLFDGKNIKNFQLQDQQYLIDGVINDGKLLDSSKVVVSTSGAGCLVFEKKTGKTTFTLNYQTGLKDDEILALGIDRNHGIWLAHNFGLTRVDAGIPLKNFNSYKGLNGNLQTMEVMNGKLFIGTSNGVYFLDKKKDYVEYTVKQAQTTSQPAAKPQATAAKPAATQEKPKEAKKGFLGRLFSKKQKNTESTTTAQSTGKEESKSSILSFLGIGADREKQPAQKKAYRIASVSHVYFKIPGFEHKCRQLLSFNGKLIAATISGAYEITETKAISILPNVDVNYIYSVKSENSIYICTNKGVTIASLIGNTWKTQPFPAVTNDPVFSFAKDAFDNYWVGSENKVYKVKLNKDRSLKDSKTFNFESETRERVVIRISDKKPIFMQPSGIYSILNDSIQKNSELSKYVGTNAKFYFTQQDFTWIRNENKWIGLSANAGIDSVAPNYLNLFDNINQIYSDQNSNLWIINDNEKLYKIDQKAIASYKYSFNSFIDRFTTESGKSFSLNGVSLDKKDNSLLIRISAPYFVKPNSNQYQHKVIGLAQDWSNWTISPEFPLLLPSGKWTVIVRARNIFGKISEEQVLTFNIKKPFYETVWFYILCAIAFLYLVSLVIKFRERKLQHEKEVLEQKVRERTQQIEEQKEEIEAQRDDLAEKNVQIQEQSNKISVQNREITDSIRYAKRLQTAVMPDNEIMGNLLSDYFVVFRPKDIVSGDFYWVNKKNDKVVVAAADCTGHGVPGGFLSMLGMSLLNEISAIDKEFTANEFLNILRARVKSTLNKEGHSDDSDTTKDGMDIALCIIDKKNKKLQFAGANNPMYLIRKGELIEYDADKMPIGAYIAEKESFTNVEVDLQPNDQVYLFSDGYRDQLGGEFEKRLKSPAFRKLLLEIHDKPMKKQKELLEQFHDNWKGNHEQVDDIMVFGLKF